MKKYLITDIKVCEVNTNPTPRRVFKNSRWASGKIGSIDEECRYTVHSIRLEDFHKAGKHLQIGMTKEVEEFLGVPMSIFLSMRREIKGLVEQFNTSKASHRETCKEVSTFYGWLKRKIRLRLK